MLRVHVLPGSGSSKLGQVVWCGEARYTLGHLTDSSQSPLPPTPSMTYGDDDARTPHPLMCYLYRSLISDLLTWGEKTTSNVQQTDNVRCNGFSRQK